MGGVMEASVMRILRWNCHEIAPGGERDVWEVSQRGRIGDLYKGVVLQAFDEGGPVKKP